MHNTLLILEKLTYIEECLVIISDRTKHIQSANDFLNTNDGVMLLDSICMRLIAIGESVKNIDKLSDKTLFIQYPRVPWKEIVGMRDIISHHYTDIEAETIFQTILDDIPFLLKHIREIKESLS